MKLFKTWTLGLLLIPFTSMSQNFQETLDQTRKKYKLPALAAAVTLHGEIVDAKVSGFRRVDADTKVTINDKFHIGSCTKSMTATLAGMLVDAGKINWTSTLEEVFPEIPKHHAYKVTTLAQLLSHCGGVPSVPEEHPQLWIKLYKNRFQKDVHQQRKTMIIEVLKLPPAYKPGSKYQYSNCGTSIAGMMLEKVSGKSWEQLLEEKICEPLKITTLGYNDAAQSLTIDQPFNHVIHKGTINFVDPRHKPDNPAAIAPAGTVHCSIIDFAKYTTIYSLSGKGFLKKNSLNKILTPQKNNYGLSWIVTKRHWGDKVIMHTGSNNMNYAVMWISPSKEFSVVAATNCPGENAARATDEICYELIRRHLLKRK